MARIVVAGLSVMALNPSRGHSNGIRTEGYQSAAPSAPKNCTSRGVVTSKSVA